MKKTLINDEFQCKVLDYNSDYLSIETGQSENQYFPVMIPHDALIGDAHNFYTDKVIWYRRKIGVTPSENKRLILYFEGVYMDASVYVGSSLVGRWVNGYTSFWFDITDYVQTADDYIYVSIDYRTPNSRWYAGPGINRNVWLYEADVNHFLIDSLYVCPEYVNDNKWNVRASVQIGGVMSTASSEEVDNIMSTNNDTCIVFHCDELGLHNEMNYNSLTTSYTFESTIDSPELWDTKNPHIYNGYAQLLIDGNVTDAIDVNFGFRHVDLTTDKGMFLNGEHIKLNGVCLHSDQGCLGTAFHKDMARRQLTLMKEMGVNAIRLTHNVQAPGFLDLCDELGLLVLNEAFDMWKLPKTTYDYARFFEEWSAKDIRSWVMRDRNHPCVFMWSAGNEIYDTHAGEEGAKTLVYINQEIRKHDFLNHAPVALCSNYMPWENTIKAVDQIKYAGYNYGEFLYKDHHKDHPDWIIFGSETASLVQSRGVYHFPLSKSMLVDDDEHCSSLGNCATSWGAPSMDKCVTTERDTQFSLGQFLWAGIDYLGEPTPYHTKNSYFGLVDTATFPKDVYYMLQSCWRSFEEKPMIHLLPYWDFNEGQLIDIRICSNAPEVELFFNDVSLGRQRIDHAHGDCMYADYQLPYSKGILKAVGYDNYGNEAVNTTESSFEDTAALKLSIDGFYTEEGDTALRFVEIEAVDRNGNPVRNASDMITVNVDGPAKLIGMCNGNQTDMDSFTGNKMRLFSGKLLAVVMSTKDAGNVTISASIDSSFIPVRKLDISADSNKPLTPENDTLTATVSILPSGATYKSIEYQITNEASVPIQNAKITNISDDGLTVTIKAIADAVFNLRAICRENDDRVTVISVAQFVAEGFGELYKDPYQFVSGSLFDESNVELGNGNEKGIATDRIKDTYILYKNINFGLKGSKAITVPIFELGGQEVKINFWKGMPHKSGSVCIGTHRYQKPSIWNVYQEETFELSEVLTGIVDFGIEVISDKIHIKGFEFVPYNDSFDVHVVKDATEIYGDQFTFTDELIAGIGNNVCITYKDMDFGNDGATKLNITGHTPLARNTIHVRFNDGTDELKQIIEFPQSDELINMTFDLQAIKGKGDMNFVFLPGSNFDFKDFQFMK